MTAILRIEDLALSFAGAHGPTKVLHGISLTVNAGERVALVGESGSGKSVTARFILGLLDDNRAVQSSGAAYFDGENLALMSARRRAALRGTQMAMIFQDPVSSLNPAFTIGRQFAEVTGRHAGGPGGAGRAAQRALAHAALDDVSIGDPERVLDAYPFQLSGGMNQRVMIAMALVNTPRLLLADEPGSALDVTVEARTLKLMDSLARRSGTAILLITHNLGVVREFADRIYVIYRGRIVEHGPARAVLSRPGHPYTRALLAAVPRITGTGLPDREAISGIMNDGDAFSAPAIHHTISAPASAADCAPSSDRVARSTGPSS